MTNYLSLLTLTLALVICHVTCQTYPPNTTRCVLQDGDFSGQIKSFPPGAYAWGEYLPWRYTTWGYLNIQSYSTLSNYRLSKYNKNFTLHSLESSTRITRNVICPTPGPTPRATRPPPEPTPYSVPPPTPSPSPGPTPWQRTIPPAPAPTPLPPTPSSPPRTLPPPPSPISTLPPPDLPLYAKNVNFPDLNWTIEFWVLLNEYPSTLFSFISQNSIDGGPDKNAPFFIGVTSKGNVLFFLGSGETYWFNLQTEFSLGLLSWYHIVVTMESTSHFASVKGFIDEKYAAIWINGKLAARMAFSSPTLTISSLPIQIGRYKNNVTTYYCDCFLDEIRFWGQCQKLPKLYSRVNMILSPSEPDLVGYWNFEDDTEFDIPDLSFVENTAVQRGSSSPYLTPVAEIGRGCDQNYKRGNWVRQFGNAPCA